MADPPRRRPTLATRLLGGGARGARAVAEATGIDNTGQVATEEAIVSALESAAFERALTQAIDSRLVDKVWEQLLESDEVQKLIERIAEAPEVRAAITSQG